MPFASAVISIDVRFRDIASAIIEDVDAAKGDADAFISMWAAGIEEDASVKDEPARLASKSAEVKAIERTTIEIEAAGKDIDAAIPPIRSETKVIASTSIDERSSSKGMRHARTDETGAASSFPSAPTCFTARPKELDAGLAAFQAASMDIADEAKSFTARSRASRP